MKVRRSFLLCAAVILAGAAFSCIAVGMLRGTSDSKENYPIKRVSVILPHRDDGYWSSIEEGILEEADMTGNDCHIDINILVPQLNYSISQMTELLKKQIAARVDYIVVQGNDDKDFISVLRKAREQGIEVICVDTDIEDFPAHLYIGSDNYEAGKMLGEQLVLLTGGNASVAIISGEEQYQNMQQRMAGFREAIDEVPGLTISRIDYDHYDGLTVMRLYQEIAGKVDALVCLEGTGGTTLESRYEAHGEEYKYVVGFDAHEGAGAGVLDGIIKQDTNHMGHQVVKEIERHVAKGSYSAECIYTDIYWLTAENYDEVMG